MLRVIIPTTNGCVVNLPYDKIFWWNGGNQYGVDYIGSTSEGGWAISAETYRRFGEIDPAKYIQKHRVVSEVGVALAISQPIGTIDLAKPEVK